MLVTIAALVVAACGSALAQQDPSAHHATPAAPGAPSHTHPSDARAAAAAARDIGIIRVASVKGLHAAVDAGVPHIVITEHLDLRVAASSGDAPTWLFNLPPTVRSIQGYCRRRPSIELTLQPRSHHQCVLLVDTSFVAFSGAAVTWLNNIYVKAARRYTTQGIIGFVDCRTDASELYATDVTIEGDGGDAQGMRIDVGCRGYVADSRFLGLSRSGVASAIQVGGTPGSSMITSLLVDRTRFVGNRNDNDLVTGAHGGTVHADTSCRVALRNCTIEENVGVRLSTSGGNSVMVARPHMQIYAQGADARADETQRPATIPNVRQELRLLGTPMLTRQSPGLAAVIKNIREALAAEAAAPPQAAIADASFDGRAVPGGTQPGAAQRRPQRPPAAVAPDDGMSPGSVAAIVASVLIVVLVCMVASFVIIHRGRFSKRTQPMRGSQSRGQKDAAAALQDADVPLFANAAIAAPPSTESTAAPPPSAGLPAVSTRALKTAGARLKLGSVDLQDPAGLTSTHEPQTLEEVLNYMHRCNVHFLGEYHVGDGLQRRLRGQGFVQFVERARDGEQFAVKFFDDSTAFKKEMALHSGGKLRDVLLPAVQSSANARGTICGPFDFVFPAFTITERGESLCEWMTRSAPDLATSLFVLLHVCQCLQRLHAVGLCHRDLKATNVLWRPSSRSWALIDFAESCPMGGTAPVTRGIHYAAPEVIRAAEAGVSTVEAGGAVDVWGLGVIAWELLTTTRAFPATVRAATVADMLVGRAELPWERSAVVAQLVPRLRVLRRSVLRCLSREAAERPSAEELLTEWEAAFLELTGTTRDSFAAGSSRMG